jgi:outer membrane receptor protein involved in Fe transport
MLRSTHRSPRALPLALSILFDLGLARAETPLPEQDSEQTDVIVRGKRPTTAASSSTVRDRDFMLRPHQRPADILSVTPGLLVVQHAGGGKANQYFLRGFDADHGSDLALFVDGIPVNLVSHGHGQGYADLHWLIPELVSTIQVYKGPYFAEFGDFATAGAVNLVTRRSLDQSRVAIGGGMLDSYRALAVASPKLDGYDPLLAAEVYGTDGPFENPENLRRYNVFAKVTRRLSEAHNSSISLALTSYGAQWHASGQIPLREVLAGRLDRFGSVDPSEGGRSQRHGAYLSYRAYPDSDSALSLLGYFTRYELGLYSNFSFASRDPINGDMIEQTDSRSIGGLSASYRLARSLSGIELETTVGVQGRSDSIDNGLFYARRRERLGSVVDSDILESSLGVYAQEDVTWTKWLRSVVGVRADYVRFDVGDRLEPDGENRVRDAALLSPKASIITTPRPELDLYLNFGSGFHSNDARGVVQQDERATPLARALGYEAGARLELFDRLDLALSAFVLDLESEIVWVGDEGTTEARGPTRRLGGEFELRVELLSWLFADADLALTRARFLGAPGGANAVPLAPSRQVSGGLSVRHPGGFFGRAGLVHVGDRPATEDRFLTAEGFTRFDATLGYRHRRFEISVSGQNLSNASWREAQFASVSRLPRETSSASCPAGTRAVEAEGTFSGCEDIHFTPGAPINVQGLLSLFF